MIDPNYQEEGGGLCYCYVRAAKDFGTWAFWGLLLIPPQPVVMVNENTEQPKLNYYD